MLWSVLHYADEDNIYTGTKRSSGQPFLDSIIPGSLSGLDTKADLSWFP
jgi:hypothetical protein